MGLEVLEDVRRTLGLCLFVLGCTGSPAPGDAGAPLADSGAPDTGFADAGPRDSGTADAGMPDSGGADGGPVLPCNAALHAFTDLMRDGGAAGVTTLGVGNPVETLTLKPGDSLAQPTFLFNQATLNVVGGDGGVTRLLAPIYAMDQSTFRISNANVDVPNGSGFFFGDQSTYDVSDSGLALGPLSPSLQLEESCGQSHASLRNNDYTVRQDSTPEVVVRDSSIFAVEANRGLVEVTLGEGGHVDLTNTTDPADSVGVYFQVSQPAAMTLHLPSGSVSGAPLVIQLPPDTAGFAQSATIINSNVFFGVWLDPGTHVTLVDSDVGMFLSYHGDGSASGIRYTPPSGPTENRVFPLNDRTLTLQNTRLSVLNIYQNASVTPGTLTLDAVTIGEHTCQGVPGTQCVVTNSTIDGSGGFVSVHGSAQLTLQGCELQTYLQADEQSVTRLRLGNMEQGAFKPARIEASGSALVSLEDEFLGYPDGGGIPSLITGGNGAIATTTVFLPLTPTVLASGSKLTVQGTVLVQTDAGTPFDLAGYALSLVQGSTTVSEGGGEAAVVAGPLGTVDTTGLDAGSYTLHVVLSGDGGVISDVTRPIQVE
jgi:hypothetical protein